MSKELTEQWRDGKLPQGWYYMIDCTGKEWFRYLSGVKPDADFVKCFKEVLAPVPTYDQFVELTEKANQFSQMVKKVHILNEACMKLENAMGCQADLFRQKVSVLESEVNEWREKYFALLDNDI